MKGNSHIYLNNSSDVMSNQDTAKEESERAQKKSYKFFVLEWIFRQRRRNVFHDFQIYKNFACVSWLRPHPHPLSLSSTKKVFFSKLKTEEKNLFFFVLNMAKCFIIYFFTVFNNDFKWKQTYNVVTSRVKTTKKMCVSWYKILYIAKQPMKNILKRISKFLKFVLTNEMKLTVQSRMFDSGMRLCFLYMVNCFLTLRFVRYIFTVLKAILSLDEL